MAQVAVRRGEARSTGKPGGQRFKRHSAHVCTEHPPVPATERHGGAGERPSGGEGHHRGDALMDCAQGLVGAWASMTPLKAARPRAGVDVARGKKEPGEGRPESARAARGQWPTLVSIDGAPRERWPTIVSTGNWEVRRRPWRPGPRLRLGHARRRWMVARTL